MYMCTCSTNIVSVKFYQYNSFFFKFKKCLPVATNVFSVKFSMWLGKVQSHIFYLNA